MKIHAFICQLLLFLLLVTCVNSQANAGLLFFKLSSNGTDLTVIDNDMNDSEPTTGQIFFDSSDYNMSDGFQGWYLSIDVLGSDLAGSGIVDAFIDISGAGPNALQVDVVENGFSQAAELLTLNFGGTSEALSGGSFNYGAGLAASDSIPSTYLDTVSFPINGDQPIDDSGFILDFDVFKEESVDVASYSLVQRFTFPGVQEADPPEDFFLTIDSDLQASADVVPEPSSLLVFSALFAPAMCFLGSRRRSRARV